MKGENPFFRYGKFSMNSFSLVIYGIELHVKYSLFWVIRKDNMYLYLLTSKTKLLTDMQEPNNCNKEGADMEIFSLSMFLFFSWIFEAFKCVIYSKKKCNMHGMFIWMPLLLQLSPFPICLLTHSTFFDLGFHVPLARVQFYLSCLKEGRWSQIEVNYSHLLFLGILRSNWTSTLIEALAVRALWQAEQRRHPKEAHILIPGASDYLTWQTEFCSHS